MAVMKPNAIGLPSHSASISHPLVKAPKIRAIAFDAFPIFDPRPVGSACEKEYPGQGAALMETWRTKLFEYQWQRALAGQYKDFMVAAEEGLVFATRQHKLELTPAKKETLLNEFLNLKVWPDAPASLQRLKEMGIDLIFLSNMTEDMLRRGLRAASLEKEFKLILSTDSIRTFKPDPKAYALGVKKLGYPKEQILFVAFAGWDLAGSKWFGYPTFWVNRQGAPLEQLGTSPDGSSRDLAGLIDFVVARNK